MAKPERSTAWPKVEAEESFKTPATTDPRDELGPEHRNKVADIANDVAQARRVAEAGASQALTY
jgi:hypothetical protein